MNKKGIIIAGFGAIGKTTLGKKYSNIIDMESGLYQWDNSQMENVPYELRKGHHNRPQNAEWPNNYYNAILEATKQYDMVLTSMHWHLLDFFENNNIEYYLAYPTLDSEEILERRCYERGNNEVFTKKLKVNLKNWYTKLKNYHPKELLIISKDEYLEDTLKRKGLIKINNEEN